MAEETTGETADELEQAFRLPQGRMLRIQRAAGWTLRCSDGAILLTQQGDSRDILLRAGDALVLHTNGRVLLDAHGDVRLHLSPPAVAARRAGWRGLFSARGMALPVPRPVLRLLAARRHGSEAVSDQPLTCDEVFRDPRLLEALVVRAHRERNEMLASAFGAAVRAVVRMGAVLRRGTSGFVLAGLAALRLQLPSLAETFAARVFLRTRM